MGLSPRGRFRFRWTWGDCVQVDSAHLLRGAAAVRGYRPPGPHDTDLHVVGVRQDARPSRPEVDRSWHCVARLQHALGIRNLWADEERFWGFFTIAWSGLPLTTRAHELGIRGAYDWLYERVDESDRSVVRLRCPHRGTSISGGSCDCEAGNRAKVYRKRAIGWAMQRFLGLDPPVRATAVSPNLI